MAKKFFVFFALSVMQSGLLPGAWGGNTNLLSNPGFEILDKSFPASWGTFDEKAKSLAVPDPEEAFEGKYSLKITADPAEVWLPVFSEIIPAIPKGTYTLAGYAKTGLTDGTIVFAIRQIKADGGSIIFSHVPVALNSGWAFYSGTFQMTEETTALQVFLVVQKCSGAAWFDNIMLVEGELENAETYKKKTKTNKSAEPQQVAPVGNLLTNPGFETAGAGEVVPQGWVFSPGGSDHKGFLDNKVVFSGKNSFAQEHSKGGLPGSYLITSGPVRIRPNKGYLLSGWLRTSEEGKSDWTSVPSARGKRVEGCGLQLVFKDDNKNFIDDFWSRTVYTDGQWERLEISAAAPANASFAEVRIFQGDFKGTSWADSLRLEMVDDTSNACSSWRLPKDVYEAGKLPPTLKVISVEGAVTGYLQEGDPGQTEYSVILKSSGKSAETEGSLVLPEVDTSFPGTFRISGEYRLPAGSEKADVKVAFQSADVYDKVISGKENYLSNQREVWNKFSVVYEPDLKASYFRTSISAKGKDLPVELRNLAVQRLSRVTLEDYAGISGSSGWQASWIWYPEDPDRECVDADRYFIKKFNIKGEIKNALLQLTADNSYSVYLNGAVAGEGSIWSVVNQSDVTGRILQGENIIAIRVHNINGPAGLVMELAVNLKDGKTFLVKTDNSFKAAKSVEEGWMKPGYNNEKWVEPLIIGVPPVSPWGFVKHHGDEEITLVKSTDGVTADSIKKGLPDVKIGNFNGVPTLFVDGKPRSLNQYWNGTRPFDATIKNCRTAGLIHVINVSNIDWSKKPALIDLKEELDQQVYQVLKNDPDGLIIICPDSTGEHGSVSWVLNNPEECYVNDAGDKKIKSYAGEIKLFPSFASLKWQQDMDEMLAGVVNHAKASDYAGHIIGFWLSGYEWFQWEWSLGRIDCSVPMRNAFRKWLSEKYKSADALQAAWGKKDANFDNVEIPSTAERTATSDGVFRDPSAGRNAVDFSRFYSELIADVLARQGRTIKETAGKNTMVTAFYGYETLFFDGTRMSSAHFALKKLLESGWVDNTCSPTDGYMYERMIGGAGGYTIMPGTFTLHGSIFVDQPDYRTHWSKQDIERTNTITDDVNIFRRNFAMNLTNLSAIQYLDFGMAYTIGDRRIVTEFGKFSRIEQFARELDRTPDNQGVAVITSEDTVDYIGTDRNLFDGGLLYHQRPLLFRAGMPHRYYLLSDLANPAMPDYKFYFFPNAFKLTEQERNLIKKKCMKNGNVLLFVYAPGYVDPSGVNSAENIGRFLGIKMENVTGPIESRIIIDPAGRQPWLKDSSGITYGVATVWTPMFSVTDPGVEVLGRYTANKEPGLVLKDFGDYKIVYSGVPLLPPDLLRDLGRLSGTNIYLNASDAFYADKNFVAIHAKSPGLKKFYLPAKADVYDLYKEEVVGRGVQEFERYLDTYETAVFYIGESSKALSFFGKQGL